VDVNEPQKTRSGDISQPQSTRGVRTNYKPFMNLTEEGEGNTFLEKEQVYAIIAGDKLNSLKEARDSPEWSPGKGP
jgi:hypothetical protein